MGNLSEITQLVLRERQGRDRGWWEQMDLCFGAGSTVDLSWFHGSGSEFVAQSKARATTTGVKPVHHCAPPVIQQNGRRGVVELSLTAEVRSTLQTVEVDLVSSMRLLYQVEKQNERWLIQKMNCIYEKDTLTPAIPGAVLSLDAKRLLTFRMPYRCLAYQFSLRGLEVGNDLYGDDRPEGVNALYTGAFAWMAQ